ncbi:RHS repeat-associated core domain-containing protein [Sorangium sp. So ce1335]|uniref:RHS repeat-associated core domain-containing protein n=1 Tax=Sorangium sp. So ce1335 TaxID=3133335 RepID=UPI003F60BDD9
MVCKGTSQGYGPNPFVGDPVNVVSGANEDVAEDFYLAGPVPLIWTRYYSSSRAGIAGELGYGHRHGLDRVLRYDLDGMLYRDEGGRTTVFPFLTEDGAQVAKQGLVLTRINAGRYRLNSRTGPEMVFAFSAYEQPGWLASLRDGEGTLRLERDEAARIRCVIDALGRRIRVARDAAGRIGEVSVEQPPRLLVRYHYDASGDLVASEDGDGTFLRYQYDVAHRMVKKTDRIGFSFLFTYDRKGRCERAAGEDGVVAVALRYFDGGTSVTQPGGGEWTYLFDANGSITQIIDPYGGTRVFEFDDTGKLVTETDPVGDKLTYVYDENGGISGRIDEAGRAVPEGPIRPTELRWTRYPANAREWDLGQWLQGGYLLPIQRELLGAVPAPVMEVLEVREPKEHSPWHDWDKGLHHSASGVHDLRDARGSLRARRWPDGSVEHWDRDAQGNVTRYVDRDGATTTYRYASWSHRVAVVDALGSETRTEWTAAERISAFTDALGTRSEFRYDLKHRLTEVRRHGALRERYEYDLADRLSAKYDTNGRQSLKLSYGRGGVLRERALGSGEVQSFEYDGRRRVTKAVCPAGEVALEYGLRGEVVGDERGERGVRVRYNGVVREVVALGRFATLYADGNFQRRALKLPNGERIALRCIAPGVVVRELCGDAREFAQYDPSGRCLARALTRGPGGQAWFRRFVHSKQGDLVAVLDSATGPLWFDHDAGHRILEARAARGAAFAFRYDRAGNLLQKPGLHGVRVREGNRLDAANGEAYVYDERNHVQLRRGAAGEVRYRYDALDRLVEVRCPKGLWTAEYDALGRRTAKSWWGGRREYHWLRHQLIAETSESGAVRIYVYADEFSITPLSFVDYERGDTLLASGKAYHVICDHRSTPVAVLDANGREVWRAWFEPYGAGHVTREGELYQPLRFPGHYEDAELGLHYNGERYYDPSLGRYLQSDPIGLGGGDNVYAYTRNPLREVDVTGLCGGKGKHDEPENCEQTQHRTDEGDEAPRTKSESTERSAFPNLERGVGRTNEHAERVARTLDLMSTQEGRRQLAREIVEAQGFSAETARQVEAARAAAASEYDAEPGGNPEERAFYIDMKGREVEATRQKQFKSEVEDTRRQLDSTPIDSDRSATVIEHSDNSVSVGLSGADTKQIQHADGTVETVPTNAPRVEDGRNLADVMNQRYPGENYHATQDNAVNIPGVEQRGKGNLPNACSEAHATQSAGEYNAENDTAATGYQTFWAGDDPPARHVRGDPPERTSSEGPTTMNPCDTCAGAGVNGDQYGTVIGRQENGGGTD